MPVRVVRGTNPTAGLRMQQETMTFGSGTAQRVIVFRGMVEPAPVSGTPSEENTGPLSRKTISWGRTLRGRLPADLFGPAGDEQLGRIAHAVHGVESRYGTDLRMWRL